MWTKLVDNGRKMGPGGEILKGQDEKLYYIGGIAAQSMNKSKAIYELSDSGWNEWPDELLVDKGSLNAWDVTNIGSDFCTNKTNITKAISYEEGWTLQDPGFAGICIKNLFNGNSASNHEDC